jgi:outer membrane protein assembly factor BamB
MRENTDAIYIGIAGAVLALERGTGAELWRASLKGKDFVNVVLDGDKVLAATKGELFCLDSTSGRILWNNELRGLGLGIVTVATAHSPLGSSIPAAEKKSLDDAEASSVVVAST